MKRHFFTAAATAPARLFLLPLAPAQGGAARTPLYEHRLQRPIKVLRGGSDISNMLNGPAQPVPGDAP